MKKKDTVILIPFLSTTTRRVHLGLDSSVDHFLVFSYIFRTCGVEVFTMVQLHSTESELKFIAGSNPAHHVPQVYDREKLKQQSHTEITLDTLKSVNHSTKQLITIIIVKHANATSIFSFEFFWSRNFLKLVRFRYL